MIRGFSTTLTDKTLLQNSSHTLSRSLGQRRFNRREGFFGRLAEVRTCTKGLLWCLSLRNERSYSGIKRNRKRHWLFSWLLFYGSDWIIFKLKSLAVPHTSSPYGDIGIGIVLGISILLSSLSFERVSKSHSRIKLK
jgi:hypothetical protein